MRIDTSVHSVAVVVPVYLGDLTLDGLVGEILGFARTSQTRSGYRFKIHEIILVNDCGPDDSDSIIRKLSGQFAQVRPVWLSRNFGQHAATIAGIAATSADWIVTLDEDGQHDPADIPELLDFAISSNLNLVYGKPIGSPTHHPLRNFTSSIAKNAAAFLSGTKGPLLYSSYRLISGEIARSVAAYAGPSVYLDVALSWITQDVNAIRVKYRDERRQQSGYTTRKLMGHFWKLAVTTGTRPLRIVSLVGALSGVFGFILAGKIVFDRLVNGIAAQGWASVLVGILILGGSTLFAIGIIAEYLGLVVRSSLGQPLYLTVRDPRSSPRFGCGTAIEK